MSQKILNGELMDAGLNVDPLTGLPHMSHSLLDVILNDVPGVRVVSASGVKVNVSTTGEVLEDSPTVLVTSSAGEAMTIVSSSAADIAVTILVEALGPNYAYIAPFPVTLNGTTPVAIGTLTRINKLTRIAGNPVGNITANSSAQVRSFLAPSSLYTRSSNLTIPAGYRQHISSMLASMVKDGGASGSIVFTLQAKPVSSTVWGELVSVGTERDGTSTIFYQQQMSPGLPGPFDVRVFAKATAANFDAQIYLTFLNVNQSTHP